MKLLAVKEILLRERELLPGVCKWTSWKFYAVLFCYLLSTVCWLHDPFFHVHGSFTWQQGFMPLLLAWFLGTACCWELRIFGKPVGGNLFLQLILLMPLSLALARIFSTASVPYSPSLMGKIAGNVEEIWKDVFGGTPKNLLPVWLREILTNWKLSAAALLLLAGLNLRRPELKIGLLVILLLVPFFSVFANGLPGVFFAGGTIFLGIGMALQFCRYDRCVFYENIVNRLRFHECAVTPAFIRVVMRIMAELFSGGEMSQEHFDDMVRKHLGGAEGEAEKIVREMRRRMVGHYHLLGCTENSRGCFLHADEKLFFSESGSLLWSVTVAPRVIVTLLFALLWIASPIDMIPDSIPVAGVLDDAAVAVLGFLTGKIGMERM